MSSDKLITIAFFKDDLDARLAAMKLDQADVPCFILDEHTMNINWFYRIVVGGIKLQVRKSDAEEAKRILDDGNADTDDSDLPETDLCCPACGSGDIEYEKYSRRMAFLSILLFNFPLSYRKDRYKCSNCGNKWNK